MRFPLLHLLYQFVNFEVFLANESQQGQTFLPPALWDILRYWFLLVYLDHARLFLSLSAASDARFVDYDLYLALALFVIFYVLQELVFSLDLKFVH